MCVPRKVSQLQGVLRMLKVPMLPYEAESKC